MHCLLALFLVLPNVLLSSPCPPPLPLYAPSNQWMASLVVVVVVIVLLLLSLVVVIRHLRRNTRRLTRSRLIVCPLEHYLFGTEANRHDLLD